MKTKLFFLLFALILSPLSFLSAEDKPTLEGIEGYWMVVENKKPTSLMAVYNYQGKMHAKILVSYNEKGVFTMENPSIAEDLQGKPKMQGLDIIWGGAPEADSKSGEVRWTNARILDPRGAKLYRAEFYRLGDEIRLRGSLMSVSWLGKNMTWYRYKAGDEPVGYKLPALSSLKPNVPAEFIGK